MGRQRNTPPTWFIFLGTVAFVLGSYYLLLGIRDYMRTGGLGVVEATLQAESQTTATAIRRATDAIPTSTLIPSFTPVPSCEDWLVDVDSAIIRGAPNVNAPIVSVVNGGDIVCVIRAVPDTDWYLIDIQPETNRIDQGFMRGDIIQPTNPTPTPSNTPSPLPTVTPITPSSTPTPSITPTPDPNATATPPSPLPPTVTPTALPLQGI